MNKMDDLGVPLFLETPIYKTLTHFCEKISVDVELKKRIAWSYTSNSLLLQVAAIFSPNNSLMKTPIV